MKVTSFNCRGLVSPSNHLSLQRLLDLSHPNVVLLQETLREEEVVVQTLEMTLKGWYLFESNASR